MSRLNGEFFKSLIFIGRPASGKSEIIDYLTKCEPEMRLKRFRITEMDVIDDFPMLWTWLEEDHILSEIFDKPRLYTDEQGYFKYKFFWNLLIERINLEYNKKHRDHANYHSKYTSIIEFSRGTEHGGYSLAFEYLSDSVLSKACIVYVQVSYEESKRKNRKRFNYHRPHSILEHSLPDEKLDRLYRNDDWNDLINSSNGTIKIRDHKIPYIVFDNEDDITTVDLKGLADRLEDVLTKLFTLSMRV